MPGSALRNWPERAVPTDEALAGGGMEQVRRKLEQAMSVSACARWLALLPGVEVLSAGDVIARAEVPACLSLSGRGAFGGYLAALADYGASLAVLSAVDEGRTFVTASLEMAYNHPAAPGRLDMHGTVERLSARWAVVSVKLLQDGRAVARGRAEEVVMARC